MILKNNWGSYFSNFPKKHRYLYVDGDWIAFQKSGDSGTIKINAQNINITENGKITTSSNNDGNAGSINLEISELSLNNFAEIASESKSDLFGGNAGTIRIGKEIVSKDDDNFEITKPGSSVSLFNNSRISTDALSSGGGKIEIQAKKMLNVLNSTISTNVQDGSGKGGDVKLILDLQY